MVSPAALAVSVGAGVGSVRALKVLVVVMGVLIVFGTAALVWVVVQRLSGVAETAPPREMALPLPEGNRIAGIAGADRALAVWVTGPEGDRLLLLDPRSGRVVGEIRAGR